MRIRLKRRRDTEGGQSPGLFRVAAAGTVVRGLALALILGGAVLTTPVAAAPEDIADPEAIKGWAVTGFRIEGLPKELASGLARGLILSGESRLIGTRYPQFYPDLLDADLARARLYLARRGYPRAVVSPHLRPDRADRKVQVVLRIRPGVPVRVADLAVTGVGDGVQEAVGRAVVLESGAVFAEPQLDRSVEGALTALREAGYAHASVRSEVERIDSTAVAVRLVAEPGPITTFGRTVVEGASADLHALVRKTVAIKPGERYSPSALRRASDSLRLLGLFRQVRVDTRETGADTLEVVARLSDRDPRTLETGVGYWTDDQFRAHARWTHRNFLRAGRGVEVTGAYSRFRQEVGGRFWWPALFGSRTRAQTGVGVTWEDEESYELTSAEIEVGARYRQSIHTTWEAGVTLADVEVTARTADADAFREKGGLLTILSAGWSRETADDRLYPHRGTVSWLRLQWSPAGALSDNPFASAEIYQSLYLPLAGDMVLASRLGAGLARPLGDSEDLLPNKRFYTGGAASNRGFKRRQLGPVDQEGDPIGGEAMLELSSEIRVPLFWRFSGVLFVDAAQTWARRSAVSLDDLAVAAGPGLMVRTPIGPVRADVGRRFGEAPGNPPRTVFHITIGNPY